MMCPKHIHSLVAHLVFHLYVVPCVLITHSYFCLVAHLVFPFVWWCVLNTFIVYDLVFHKDTWYNIQMEIQDERLKQKYECVIRTHGTTYFCLVAHLVFPMLYHVSDTFNFCLVAHLVFHLYVVPCVLITHSYFCLVAHLVFPFVQDERLNKSMNVL